MAADKGSVLAMGTFDGVHRGHQAVVRKAVSRARALGLRAVVMSFKAPPRLFFRPETGPVLLTLSGEKEPLLKTAGADAVLSLSFGKPLASLRAQAFLDRFVLGRWKAREVVVGYNFAFGKGREGTPSFLRMAGEKAGVKVHVVPPVTWRGAPVSSGRIRQALKEGDLSAANAALGYPYALTARVKRGDGRGRRLGFPTANLAFPAEKIVPPGVYAVRVVLPDGKTRGGMANVGVRPTLNAPDPRLTVEVHLFDFSGDLVGKTLRVSFLRKLRAERRFPSFDHLVKQLHADGRRARAALARGRPLTGLSSVQK